MQTIGDIVSRVRGQIKAESEDAFVTDRYLYSLVKKYAQVYMRRQDNSNKLMKFNGIWQTLDYVELIDIAANQWAVNGMVTCAAGSNIATMFSATVS